MKTTNIIPHAAWTILICLAMFFIHSAYAQPAAYDDDHLRAQAVQMFSEHGARNKAIAIAWAQLHGLPLRSECNGVTRELMALDAEGSPLYYSTANANAAISTAANVLRTDPYNLLGISVTVGVWDAGSVLSTHQEFDGRVRVMDGGASHWHSTHVGGTIAASGTVAAARGMAPRAIIHSYEWNDDIAEMAARAASAPGQGSKIYLSNHSYGLDAGWFFDHGWHWRYSLTTVQDPAFGRYDDHARDADEIVYNAPYYLPMFCGMNSRSDGPANGDVCYYWNGSSWSSFTYNSAIHPPGDGVYKNGYDTLAWFAVSKNVLTVGAVDDAVLNFMGLLFRWLPNATMSAFSNWGPTDDGRIKPDVVGNGVDVYSTHNNHNAAYATLSGTSMATPNVCGTAAQMLQYFRRFGNEPRASTMKALLIHTADDLGTPGPDYSFGWGLVNGAAAADVIAGDHRGMGVTHIREGLRSNGDAVTEYFYTSLGAAPFKATLCWTDPPGEVRTGDDDRTPNLINDLDLRVIDPNAVMHYPFRLSYSNPSAAATRGNNARDNVEQVLITNPSPGTYSVRVSHAGTLSNGAQRFSLIVTHEPYPLPAPTGVAASDGTYAGYVRVTWNAVAGASSYTVYSSTNNSSATAIERLATSGLSFNDTAAAPGMLNYYWVKARSTLSDSRFSSFNSGFLAPVAPTGVSASDGAFINQIAVVWRCYDGNGHSCAAGTRGRTLARSGHTPSGETAMKTDVRVAPSEVMLMAIEVSEKSWLVGFSNGTQRRRREVPAWDVAGLLQAVEQARQKLGYAPQAAVRCCYEASRDGFSIHRMLEHHGIHNTVLDPASIEVDRRRRRSKTDRIDVDKLLGVHERHAYYGQHDGWRWARVPSTAAEAAMRPQRERQCLQRERTMHVNRIRALLALHGVRCGNVRRLDPAALRDWAGQPFAAEYQAHLTRELERLRLADQQLRAVEAGQRARLMARATPTDDMAWRLYLLRGIGLQGATTLAAEYFGWRAFTNRKQVGGLSGLCGSPYSSGESWREQGISKAGNRRVRTLLIQLAWLWLDWQPTSALAIWYQQRTAQGGARERRRMIVALARKLLVALWKYLEYGIVPDGAVMKSVRGRRLVA